MAQQMMQGALIEFRAGTVIFKEGDTGGDLYFIKEGEVEVYKEKAGLSVTLATLKKGEVLGIMTCLTRDPRLASARALTDVKAHVVKQAGFKTLISSTQPWVHAVVKDFIVRIRSMDELYLKVVSEARVHVESPIGRATMLARAVVAFGEPLATGEAGARSLGAEDFLGRVAQLLGGTKQEYGASLEACGRVGILKVTGSGPGAQIEVNDLSACQFLPTFVSQIQDEPVIRERWETIDDAELDVLIGLADAAMRAGAKAGSEYRAALSRLRGDRHPIDVAKRAIAKAGDLELVKLEGEGDQTVVLRHDVLRLSVLCWRLFRAVNTKSQKSTGEPIKALTESF